MSQLVVTAPTAKTAPKARCCMECGAELPPRKSKQGSAAKFCSPEHRAKFNNRRMTRGAMLYDLYMQGRYERAEHADNITTMAQVARIFREMDDIELSGRASWADPHADSHYDPFTEAVDRLNAMRRELTAA